VNGATADRFTSGESGTADHGGRKLQIDSTPEFVGPKIDAPNECDIMKGHEGVGVVRVIVGWRGQHGMRDVPAVRNKDIACTTLLEGHRTLATLQENFAAENRGDKPEHHLL
jgi:hypothetical protein